MKKSVLSLVLVFVCVLGLMAGCVSEEPIQTTAPIETTQDLKDGELAGILLVNAGASVEIMYDINGIVTQVAGYGANGLIIGSEYKFEEGIEVDTAVQEIVALCVEKEFIPKAENVIVLKQIIDSALPTENFLDDAVIAAYNGCQDTPIVIVTNENLDSNGYINSEKAEEILCEALALHDTSTIAGRYTTHAGLYYFTAKVNDQDVYYTVDATSGDVVPCSAGDYEKDIYIAYGPEDLQGEYPEEEPTFIEETVATEPTVVPEQTIPATLPAEEIDPTEE